MSRRIPWGILAALAIWFFLTGLHLVDPLFLASPVDVVREFSKDLGSGDLARNLLATLYRLAVGFSLGALVGVPLGLVMGYSQRVYHALEALIEIMRATPVIALFPLFMLVFGLGDKSKFMIAAWSSSLIILVNTMYGVQHSSRLRQMVARSMKATNWHVFTRVVFPDALPEVLVGFRTGVSIALIVVLMSEMFLGTELGLGQMIYNAQVMYAIPRMYVGILVAGILGYGVNLLLLLLQRRIVHWGGDQTK